MQCKYYRICNHFLQVRILKRILLHSNKQKNTCIAAGALGICRAVEVKVNIHTVLLPFLSCAIRISYKNSTPADIIL
jgi:hypothetical protein